MTAGDRRRSRAELSAFLDTAVSVVGDPQGVFAIDQGAMLNKVKARLFGEGGDASPDDASARDDRPDATRIGRFEITRRLGAGAMGVVFLARDLELDRRVAIKLLQPRFTGREGLERAQQRMRREARAMARLNHPNVVAVHEVGVSRGRLYLAMELVSGPTLTRWLATEARAWDEIVNVFVCAGRGLGVAHAAGLVHRDFKPDSAPLE